MLRIKLEFQEKNFETNNVKGMKTQLANNL